MSKRKILIAVAAVVAMIVAWAVFRPELLFISKTVNESLPGSTTTSAQQVLATGTFYGVAHETKGVATIYGLANGKRVLRFTNFETSNGPDVRVFLAAANKPNDNDAVKNSPYISLGSIKGNKGDQNYELPADAMLSDYNSVVIWCNRFGVNFGAASLKKDQAEHMTLSQGMFQGVAHETKGYATIYQLANGKRILRLTQFETSNGPDVRVFLASAGNPVDNDAVKKAGYVSLGSIKGTKGDQNYEIPSDLELEKYHSVVIWCNRFGVNFGFAQLAKEMTMN